MKKNWIVWGIALIALLWIFHIHFNRGVPVKRSGGR